MSDRYRCIRGLNYPGADGNDVRRSPGEIVDDLPKSSIASLIEVGAIEPEDDSKESAPRGRRARRGKE